MRKLGFVLAGFTTLTTPLLAQASVHNKADLVIAKQLASPSRKGWTSVIVKTEGALTASQKAAIQALGGDVYRHLPIINSLAVRVPKKSLGKLAALPFVSRLSSDMEVKKNDEFVVKGSLADTAWNNYGVDGTGIAVAVLDSGIKFVEDLESSTSEGSRILAGVNFGPPVPQDPMGDDPYNPNDDLVGHGTHVAGIIAGNGKESTGKKFTRTFYGVARKANLVNVRVLDENGVGSVSNVIAGIQWTINNRATNNIRVMNLSLGHPVGESYTTDPLCQAAEAAWKAGIVVVCAAGNEGRAYSTQVTGRDNEGWGTNYGSINSPGNDPYVITVGAMKDVIGPRSRQQIATYSSRGPSRIDYVVKPDILAPGNRVISTLASRSYLATHYSTSNVLPLGEYYKGKDRPSGKYFYLSGTSMAAPVVAGAAALLLQKDPGLTPDAVKARLMVSADKWCAPNGSGDALTYGAGYINIPAALNTRITPTRYALSPQLILNPSTQKLTIDPSLWGSQAMWGEQAIWGTQEIWGDQAIWGAQTIWGDQAIWGSQETWGDQAIWGTQTLWSTQSSWTDQAIWGTTTSRVDLTNTAIQGEK